MKNKVNIFFRVSFTIPIILILISGVLFYNSYCKSKEFVECEAKIIDFRIEEDKTYINKDNRFKIIPTMEYYLDGKLYTEESRFYSSSMRKGETTQIMCNPNNPSEFITKGSIYLFPIIIACIGFVLLGFSILFKFVFDKLIIKFLNLQ